jgi:hypothetical protein
MIKSGKTIKINLQRKMFTRKNIIMKKCDTKHSASKSRLKFFEKKNFFQREILQTLISNHSTYRSIRTKSNL